MNDLKNQAGKLAGRLTITVAAALMLALHPAPAPASAVLELVWDDLIPDDYEPPNPMAGLGEDEYANLADGSPEAERMMSELRAAWDNAPVVEKLDGKTIRLPGFVVPLDFEAEKVSEFLLVPYFGACIHVPPPPANQIVFVKSEKGIEIERLFDAVIIQGRMETSAVSSKLAEAGYTLYATDVSPFDAGNADPN